MKAGDGRRRGSRRGRPPIRLGRGIVAAVALVVVVAALIVSRSLGRSQPTSTGPALTTPTALAPAQQPLAVGTTAPDFDLATLDGQRYRLSSLRGQPVLLEFFAVWCPHCQAEVPTLNKLSSTFAPNGLKVLGILANPYGRTYDTSSGTDRSPATAEDLAWYIRTFGVNYPSLIDPTFATVNQSGVSSYPTLFIVDRNGIIRYVNLGEVTYDALVAAVTAATTGP